MTAEPAVLALLRHERTRWKSVLETQPSPARGAPRAAHPRPPTLPLPARGRRALPGRGPPAPRRRHGPRQDRAGHRRLPRPLRTRAVSERGLLIVPASLKPQWLREWQLFTDAPAGGRRREPRRAPRGARTARPPRASWSPTTSRCCATWSSIQRWAPDLVVLDEAQRIKNWATKTAAYVKALDARPTAWCSPGTPMENRLEELASIARLGRRPRARAQVAPGALARGVRRRQDGRSSARATSTPCGRGWPAASLRRGPRRGARAASRRAPTRVVPVEITEEQAEEHDELDAADRAAPRRGSKRRPLTQAEFLRLMSLLTTQRIIANGLAQLQLRGDLAGLSSARAARRGARFRALVEPEARRAARAPERQVVVAAGTQGRGLQPVAAHAHARPLGRRATCSRDDGPAGGVLHRRTRGQRRRTQNIVDFHDDPACRVLFASDAGGVGLNLQRAASCCINLELPWNPAVLEQRIGRIYRLGQKPPDRRLQPRHARRHRGADRRPRGRQEGAASPGLFDGNERTRCAFERSASFLARLERIVEPARAPEAAAEAPVDDGAAEREVDGLLAAAEDVEAHRRERGDRSGAALPAHPRSRPGKVTCAACFRSSAVRRRDDGGLAIEAPPEAADGLAALFEGMAQLLRTAGTGR